MQLFLKILFSDYFFLIPLFIIGIITSYEDLRYGKIRNKWIEIGFLWGGGIFIILIFGDLITSHFSVSSLGVFRFNFDYLKDVLFNTGIAFGVGFLMWHLRVWSAGDAKLFTLFAFLLPLRFYSRSFLNYFPSFALLLNIFIVSLGAFSIVTLLEVFTKRKIKFPQNKKIVKENKTKNRVIKIIKNILNLVIIFFVISCFSSLLFGSSLGRKLNYFFTVTLGLEKWTLSILGMGAFIFLLKFLRKIKKTFYILGLILTLWLGWQWLFGRQLTIVLFRPMILNSFIIVFGGFAFRKIFDWYIREREILEIKIDELKEGMRLTEDTISGLKQTDKRYFEEAVGKIYSDGLTREQINFLKKFLKDKKISLRIYRSYPFAILILGGVALTIILKGTFIQYLI